MKFQYTGGAALLILSVAFSACGDAEKATPSTPEAMYTRAQELIKPNVEGESSDFAGAMQWLKRAAEAGFLPALLDLGGIYLEGGKGVQADPSAAFDWFSRAAAQGSAEAEFYLGHIFYNGLGRPADKKAAAEHWRKASDGGVAEASYRLAHMLLAEQATRAEGLELLHKAAAADAPKLAARAACDLGNIYAKGQVGVAVDMKKAAEWYARSARGGNARAQLVYAIMLLSGESVPADAQQGMAMLRLSAGQDNPQAIALLINLLRNGEHAADSEEEAAAWSERLESLRRKKPENNSGE